MSKKILFISKEQVEDYRKKIMDSANEKVDELLQLGPGMEFLRQVKFNQCGYDPLFEEQINFIEQVNQTFTYLVCLSAVDILLSKHSSHKFYVNFGTQAGFDVVSEDQSIICECFAATAPDSNCKLEKDVKRVHEDKYAVSKYVIYYVSSPKPVHLKNIRNKYQEVKIIELDCI